MFNCMSVLDYKVIKTMNNNIMYYNYNMCYITYEVFSKHCLIIYFNKSIKSNKSVFWFIIFKLKYNTFIRVA